MGFRHQLKPHALPVLVVVKDICHHHRGGCMTLIFLYALRLVYIAVGVGVAASIT
ncbi:hypothetical protein DCAR_0104855 [Daucus carota subsp. sativus]|uniref:Uncharacterized protein n=1 Tax=Daucus carota subsp. sativus TaxID=79200 RepID=A0A166J5X3_DAUCS|nr:hypothetical protein DCAR_0104855 [Daucus carota subsp. sativus]